MRKLWQIVDGMLAGINKGITAVAAVVVLAMALIGTLDVLTTNIFNQAVAGAVELSCAGLVLVVFLGLAAASRTQDHIVVDILMVRLPRRWRKICQAFGLFSTAIFFGFWTYQAWKLAAKSISVHERALGLLPVPIYPMKTIAFGALVLATTELSRRFVIMLLNVIHNKDGE